MMRLCPEEEDEKREKKLLRLLSFDDLLCMKGASRSINSENHLFARCWFRALKTSQ